MRPVFLPMHGECKLRREGLRTRDAHLMEWLAKENAHPVDVISRPEPWPRVSLARLRGNESLPTTWRMTSPQPIAMPDLRNPKDWWRRSTQWLPSLPNDTDTMVGWNVFALAHYLDVEHGPLTAVDLLDDWSTHPNFESIWGAVEEAYERVLSRVDIVIANSPRTQELARRFGRDDVVLIRNGCDPDRFGGDQRSGDQVRIGYAGKIGARLDTDVLRRVAEALPSCEFVLAGPVIDRETVREITHVPNVTLVGDVPYSRYPDLLATWDVGWAPHRADVDVAIGGDLIKLYEYRAAGLPAFTTPLSSVSGLEGVRVASPEELPSMLSDWVASHPDGIPREPTSIPVEATWSHKARQVLDLLQGAS